MRPFSIIVAEQKSGAIPGIFIGNRLKEFRGILGSLLVNQHLVHLLSIKSLLDAADVETTTLSCLTI